ncbi:MAG: UDP-N-acetylmuramyl-tripeptide synthetase, partial [Spirochaetales bacterium]|nr:UDP-N-acetylmuramyl-tripeptide synthetase [Spirochaetales bacterium]
PRHQTTPEATSVQRMLDSMANAGYEYAVVEASSHGLSPRTGRLTDVAFDVGVMTNVRHEHLEFHGTWERYRDDKARLFSALDTVSHRKRIGGVDRDVAAFGVVCADDPSAGHFSHATKHRVYSYSSTSAAADLYASDIQSDDSGSSFVIHDRTGEHPDEDHAYPARIELPGYFNVENTLAAVLVVSRLTGIGVRELVPLLPRMEPVLGRMTRLVEGQPFEVLVDYAHTPSSFEAILPPLRARITGKLICVFGSGGERDVQKRPAQGRIASTYCDAVILADEDPRGEDPVALLKDIAAGCESMEYDVDLFLIPDRVAAIRKAVSIAKPGDAVLLLGKGHEHTIDYA